MIFTKLNASGYEHSSTFYQNEFEDILKGVIVCYNLMIDAEVSLSNDENQIRDVLILDYLGKNSIRERVNLTGYLFDREVSEGEGIIDIKIQTHDTFTDTSAYYVIECKRLNAINRNGATGLNAEYVKNGICRFVTEYYSSHHSVNGMLGFVVEDLDIDNNIGNINSLLSRNLINDRGEQVNTNVIEEIRQVELKENFNYSYISKHNTASNKELTLYHLMLDFSNNIEEQ